MSNTFKKSLVELRIGAELQERPFCFCIGKDGFCAQLFAILQSHTFGASVMYQDFLDRRIRAYNGTVSLRGGRHSEADTPHATPYIAPRTMLPVDLPKHMMPCDINGARCFRADKAPDYSLSCISST